MRMKTTAGDSLYADSPGQQNDAKSIGKNFISRPEKFQKKISIAKWT